MNAAFRLELTHHKGNGMTIGTDVAHAASKAIDLTELTVETVQAGFASGAFTAEQLTRACLGRIATYNPRYNATNLKYWHRCKARLNERKPVRHCKK